VISSSGLKRAASSLGAPEIQIVAAQDEIVNPARVFEAERLP
jgi:pyridoxal/pyridoxine/pyridoxamine kinase